MDFKLPEIGLGTGPSRGEAGIAFMVQALREGYRLLDSAAHYRNEHEVGEAVRASGVKRDDIVVVTKIWPDHHHADDLRTAAELSLKTLDLSHIDLLLLHWPNPTIPFAETFGALGALRAAGLTREIGVSNFTSAQLAEARQVSSAPIVANEIEYHPYLNQDAVLAACREAGIAVIGHCPLGRVGTLFQEKVILDIAGRIDRSQAQVVLKWQMQQGVIPIPGTTKLTRLRENIDVFDFELDPADMAAISALSAKHHRICAAPIAYPWDA